MPSLEWWAARSLAQHKSECNECSICSCAATSYARERIDRALRGEDALEWIKVAATHPDTDYLKAAAIVAYLIDREMGVCFERRSMQRPKLVRTIDFTIAGRFRRVIVHIYTKNENNITRVVRPENGLDLLAPGFPFRALRVYESPHELGTKPDISAYSHYEITNNMNPKYANVACILRELMANGVLRTMWIPLRRQTSNVWPGRTVRVKCKQCEYSQLDSAPSSVIEI
jgi:hypothetical protein